jgi:hypothetical protein
MNKSEWKKQHQLARWYRYKFTNTYRRMQGYMTISKCAREAVEAWEHIYISSVWLKPQKLTRLAKTPKTYAFINTSATQL